MVRQRNAFSIVFLENKLAWVSGLTVPGRSICSSPASKHHRVQITFRGRVEIGGSVSALSAGAYITNLYVMVDIVKWGERAPPTLTRLG